MLATIHCDPKISEASFINSGFDIEADLQDGFDPNINVCQSKIDLTLSEPIEILTPESVSSQQYLSTNGGTGLLVVRESNRMVDREYSYLSTSGWVDASISYSLPGPILSIGEILFILSNIPFYNQVFNISDYYTNVNLY